MNTRQLLRPSAHMVATVRDELRERRQARAARRTLERELATYTTPAEVNDLLGSLHGQDEREVEAVRRVLVRNLQHAHRVAS